VLKAAGQYVDVLGVGGGGVLNIQAHMDFVARWTGDKPMIAWEGIVANPDSGRWRNTFPEKAGWSVSTQEARGLRYRHDLASLVNATVSSSGSRPVTGFLFWEWRDNWGEKTNWGLVSLLDNAYDGREARRSAGSDAWGYSTGGEERDYGNFLDSVRDAHAMVGAILVKEKRGRD
jgi:hypothetical protein